MSRRPSDLQSDPDPTLAKGRLVTLGALWPFVRRQRGLLVAWLVALAASSAATLSLPVAVRRMIDEGFTSADSIDSTFLLLFAVIAVLALATGLRFFFVSLLGERVVADLRQRLYAHILSLDPAFFERTRSGELVSRLSADTELLRSVVGSSISVALRSFVMVLGSIAMLFVTDPRLALWTLVGIPLFVLPIVVGSRRLRKVSRQSQDRIADANALASEVLGNIGTVQAHAREPYERGRFTEAVAAAVAAARRRIGLQAMVTVVAMTLFLGAIVGVLWMGAQDVVAQRMSAGTLGQFMLYAVLGGGSVGALAEVWNEVQRAAGGMGRINDLFVERAALVAPADARPLPVPLQGAIDLEQVSFHYPTRIDAPALEDFTLHVRPGETVALVGPSGAGKSTVFALLLRFHDPQSGTIRIDGVDIRQVDPTPLREHIALVPQAPTIFASSAADNIRYGRLEATDEDLRQAARSAEAHAFIEALPQGYASELGERGARLSGGQQQRVAIARAIVTDSAVLLADEPTGNLDSMKSREIMDLVTRLNRDQGITVVMVTHEPDIAAYAGRTLRFVDGRIASDSPQKEAA
jgi:ATP-binding cassette subfamily B protein